MGVDIAHNVNEVVDGTDVPGKVGSLIMDTSLGGPLGVPNSVVLDGT